jgi:hypothetical protein
MKWEEISAKKYLESAGFQNILYEPDGNIPPDFLIDSTIAVEVRRLNQHIKISGSVVLEPIEKLHFSLIPKIESLLEEFSNVPHNNSAYVTIDYSRPLKLSKELLAQIKKTLDINLDQLENLHIRKIVTINKHLKLSIWPTNMRYESAYILGAIADDDTGGMVVSNVYKNLKLIIKEKENKIKPHFSKYKTWWLILIDLIGYGLREYDMEQLNSLEFETSIFNKIILLDPENPTICKFLNKLN